MAGATFERIEKKYLITEVQYDALLEGLSCRVQPDAHSSYEIGNLYYDTDRYDLIRASTEKPVYKEKLRLRCYGRAEEGSPVFLELKRKVSGTVYKRRVGLPYREAKDFLSTGRRAQGAAQIDREIEWFLSTHEVSAKAYLYYRRQALSGAFDPGLRLTFDREVRFRTSELRLDGGTFGAPLLPPGQVLMEVKVPGAFPMWLGRLLSTLRIHPCSFSKYGAGYRDYILKEQLLKRRDQSA